MSGVTGKISQIAKHSLSYSLKLQHVYREEAITTIQKEKTVIASSAQM
jgi:hypothetical protein